MLQLIIFVLSCCSLVQCQLPSLLLLPPVVRLPILKGDVLKLECINTYKGSASPLSFRKDDMDILVGNDMGYQITTTSTTSPRDDTVTITTKTLIKNATTFADEGSYTCYLDEPILRRSIIHIVIVDIRPQHAMFSDSGYLFSDSRPVTLSYEIRGWPDSVEFSWQGFNDQDLIDGGKYQTFNNGTLVINNPNWDDLGEYKCIVTFNPSSFVEKTVITPKPVALRGGPKIVSRDIVQGTKLELNCKARGFPKPTIQWFKDGNELNTTVRLHFSDFEGTANGKLIIFNPTDNDAGEYVCVAGNDVERFNTEKYLHVTNKPTTSRQMQPTARQETRDFASIAFYVAESIASLLGVLVVILVVYICIARWKRQSSTYEHNEVAGSTAPTAERPECVPLQTV
ncbi:hypothetical protein DPMN_056133 [Dreissena polymorpha]|uniref:Ig-like domain-containing protein n=2 Tax=Dreissena polymorpha TaxID=45954 RepID=A0A9D4HR85_DREPO|nr:hypothetical protein DPMN_056133 [Dreissena polymorpha]